MEITDFHADVSFRHVFRSINTPCVIDPVDPNPLDKNGKEIVHGEKNAVIF